MTVAGIVLGVFLMVVGGLLIGAAIAGIRGGETARGVITIVVGAAVLVGGIVLVA